MTHTSLPLSEHQNQLSCFPYGVGHDTEGICLLLRMGNYRILLDCGLTNIKLLEVENEAPADLVLCSHAHSDHAQGLLPLHQAFPQMPMYASEVTVKLLPLNWLRESPEEIPEFCQSLPWRSSFKLYDDLSVELYPAGHLPGAACILLTYETPEKTYQVLYTGDFCSSNFQLVEGLSIETLRGLSPDVLIVEGSYGTSRHPHRRQQEKHLMERIKTTIQNNQNVLLPVPTLGLGQEILKLLRSHHQFTGQNIDIWVDGQVAIACDFYLQLLHQFPASVQNFAKHQPLFWDDRVCPRMGRLTREKTVTIEQQPCIVITDETTDISKYFHDNQNYSWLVLLSQHPEVANLQTAKLNNSQINSHINIETYLLSEHSDGRNTTQLIHNLRPQHIIFVHGSPTYLADLTSLEELQNRYQLHSPGAGTLVELPIGEQFIQPNPPQQTYYEGELNETGSFVTISLPDTINRDPRWHSFADTGLVEARWQGEELVLRSISQRELLNQSQKAKIILDNDCCSQCLHYNNQRCWNPSSPLYGFKVTPEGYCPVFEPLGNQD